MHMNNGMVKQLVVAVVVLTCTLAQASLVPVDIGADGNAMGGWQGRVEYRSFGSIVAADVEYAVYSPGTFVASYPGMDPSGGSEYVYAYQIYNDLQPHPTLYNMIGTVTLFSVGVYDPVVSYIGSVSGTGDVSPDPASIIPDTARWEFTGAGQINHPQTSEILIFTSAYEPMTRTASLSGSAGGAGTYMLPSPIVPEPGCIALVLTGFAIAIGRRSR